jgi:prepilin-type N-terminal cleavage/methylation domain-containing protein
MTFPNHSAKARQQGLTLVELLICLALIGAVSAMVIMSVPAVREHAFDVQYQRNAQEIATVYAAGNTAGVSFLIPGDLEATVREVIAGKTASHGPFQGKLFKVGTMPEDSISGALAYLDLQNDMLVYKGQ